MGRDSHAQRNEGSKGAALVEAKRAARERYALIAEALKIEAGVSRHYQHKELSGIAWTGAGKILAPEGVTRRQLYVLAHECAHVVLHRSTAGAAKPGHVKEHEAEVYAHRAFARYGLDVPERSTRWARAYVGQWIMKDHTTGMSISQAAVDFANGKAGPDAPLATLDRLPSTDLSKSLQRHLAKGERTIAEADRQQVTVITPAQQAVRLVQLNDVTAAAQAKGPPNACGTCLYFDYPMCSAFSTGATTARRLDHYCNNGQGWRPHPRELAKLRYDGTYAEPVAAKVAVPEVKLVLPRPGFWSRLGDALIERVRGRR